MKQTHPNREQSALSDTGLADALREIVGEHNVILEPDLKRSYESDLTGRYEGRSRVVVLPANAEQCSDILDFCSYFGVPLVPQGGNTGLVGGAIPRENEIVLSTRRLNNISEIDQQSLQMTVEAGVTLQEAQAAARRLGYELTIDHGARSAATIGGMVATDAGGAMALRYGTMRSHIVGLEAVMADGSIISRMSGLIKDNAGYRWPDIMAGSEGTLALITRVRLRLQELPKERVSALFGVQSMSQALAFFRALRERAPSLRAADFFDQRGMRLVCSHRKLSSPLAKAYPCYVIAECAGQGELLEELSAAAEQAGIDEQAVAAADDSASQERLWLYRDGQNEAVRAEGVPHKLDVSVPLSGLADFEVALQELLKEKRPSSSLVLFGHLGDGNCHVNILGLEQEDYVIDGEVLSLVAKMGGSISAEHGIGVAKVEWLSLVRSPEEISLMKTLKAAFDPQGILSAGRVLP